MASVPATRTATRLALAAVATLGLVALAAFALRAAPAAGEQLTVGNVRITAGGNFKPKKLPAKRMAPITLRVFGNIRNLDADGNVIQIPQADQAVAPEGSRPPVVQRILVDFPRQGDVFTGGLPRCNPNRLRNQTTRTALRRCGDALVGRGQVNGVVDFPDQAPFVAPGPLLIFNGPRQGGDPTVVFHVFANPGAPTAFVVQARIAKAPGKPFGRRVVTDIPRVAGGHGTLTDFRARVGRRWMHKGKRRSYLLLRCGQRRLRARGVAHFLDHPPMSLDFVRRCQRR